MDLDSIELHQCEKLQALASIATVVYEHSETQSQSSETSLESVDLKASYSSGPTGGKRHPFFELILSQIRGISSQGKTHFRSGMCEYLFVIRNGPFYLVRIPEQFYMIAKRHAKFRNEFDAIQFLIEQFEPFDVAGCHLFRTLANGPR